MIKHTIIFSLEDAKQVFESAGLNVQFKDVEHRFHSQHEDEEPITIPTWVVSNPTTGEDVLLEEAFRVFLSKRNKQLFLQDVNRLDIYSLFK